MAFLFAGNVRFQKITSWYINVHKKMKPEEFQFRNLQGIWGSPCSASKWVFQIFPRGRLYSRRWRHHEWQKMWDFNLTAKHIDLFLLIFSKPSHHIQVEQQFLVSPHSMLSTFTNCSMVRFWYNTLKKYPKWVVDFLFVKQQFHWLTKQWNHHLIRISFCLKVPQIFDSTWKKQDSNKQLQLSGWIWL